LLKRFLFPKFGDFIFDLLLHNIRRTQIYDTEKPEYYLLSLLHRQSIETLFLLYILSLFVVHYDFLIKKRTEILGGQNSGFPPWNWFLLQPDFALIWYYKDYWYSRPTLTVFFPTHLILSYKVRQGPDIGFISWWENYDSALVFLLLSSIAYCMLHTYVAKISQGLFWLAAQVLKISKNQKLPQNQGFW